MKKVILFSIAAFFAFNTFANNTIIGEKFGNPILTMPTKTVTLDATTTIQLELAEQLRSQKLTVGRIVKFSVLMNVKAEGHVVIRTGAMGIGRIKSIERNSYNDPEEVNIEITAVQAVDNTMVDVNGTESVFLGDNSGEEATIASLPKMICRVMNDTDIDTK
jgi:hypothetical protein